MITKNICSMLTEENMRTALDRLRCIEMLHNKLSTYQYLQDSLLDYDVSTDEKYRKAFKSFYRVRRNDEWCDVFFSILQLEKHDPANSSFSSVLKKISDETGQLEASFCSKLVATINTDLPVLDGQVRDILCLKRPSGKELHSHVKQYSDLKMWVLNAIGEECFGEWRRLFDGSFPQFQCFTDMKKLDLFLWQLR